MIFIPVSTFVCCFFTLCGSHNPDPLVGNANNFIDIMIANIKEELAHDLNPYRLPEKSISFEQEIFQLPLRGQATLYDGYLTGLDTLHRAGDCTILKNDNIVNITVSLGMGVMSCSYKVSVAFMNRGRTVDIIGRLGYASVKMNVIHDSLLGENHLQDFTLDQLNGLTISVKGLGPLSFVLNKLSSAVLILFEGLVKNIVEWTLRPIVKTKIMNYDLSFLD
ncbi:mite allergen Lep d 7-like [Tachypleus tridentatus]|uniref:mite allergen Lep d 7-like n=1 Tax=Tachypleus tridentatus TaxID=6853 RepID=UPI003FD3A034